MKYLSILFIITCFALCCSSCKKDETQVVMNSSKPVLSTNTTAPIVLLQQNADNTTALTLTYDDINLGFDDALSYVLQISPTGHEFKSDSLVEIDLNKSALSKSFTAKELNTILLKEFLPAGQTINYEFRIKSSAGNIYSNELPLTITTYEDWPRALTQPFIYTPGAYQGWDPSSPTIAKMYVVSGTKTDGKLEGGINFPDASNEFKFTPEPVWDNSYGSVTNTGNAGTLALNGGGNFAVMGKGYYKMNLDLTAKTWRATLTNWAIIGEAANGWDPGNDVYFEFDPVTQTLFKTLAMKVGEFKFRANGAWDLNFPAANLKITEAGTYKILLDMRVPSDPYWKIIKQ